jgi:hypothetical protein
MKLNVRLVKSSLAGALGSILFGFDTTSMADTTHALTVIFWLGSAQHGIPQAAEMETQ